MVKYRLSDNRAAQSEGPEGQIWPLTTFFLTLKKDLGGLKDILFSLFWCIFYVYWPTAHLFFLRRVGILPVSYQYTVAKQAQN